MSTFPPSTGTHSLPRHSAALLGIDVKGNKYTALGSPDARVSSTAEIDIARSVAQLAILSLDPATAASVPDNLRVAPVTFSYASLAETVARVRGVPRAKVVSEDLVAYKDALSKNPTDAIFDYLR